MMPEQLLNLPLDPDQQPETILLPLNPHIRQQPHLIKAPVQELALNQILQALQGLSQENQNQDLVRPLNLDQILLVQKINPALQVLNPKEAMPHHLPELVLFLRQKPSPPLRQEPSPPLRQEPAPSLRLERDPPPSQDLAQGPVRNMITQALNLLSLNLTSPIKRLEAIPVQPQTNLAHQIHPVQVRQTLVLAHQAAEVPNLVQDQLVQGQEPALDRVNPIIQALNLKEDMLPQTHQELVPPLNQGSELVPLLELQLVLVMRQGQVLGWDLEQSFQTTNHPNRARQVLKLARVLKEDFRLKEKTHQERALGLNREVSRTLSLNPAPSPNLILVPVRESVLALEEILLVAQVLDTKMTLQRQVLDQEHEALQPLQNLAQAVPLEAALALRLELDLLSNLRQKQSQIHPALDLKLALKLDQVVPEHLQYQEQALDQIKPFIQVLNHSANFQQDIRQQALLVLVLLPGLVLVLNPVLVLVRDSVLALEGSLVRNLTLESEPERALKPALKLDLPILDQDQEDLPQLQTLDLVLNLALVLILAQIWGLLGLLTLLVPLIRPDPNQDQLYLDQAPV